jgi:hypothetical protein
LLTPVILATQEAEIRRIVAQSQPGEKSSEDPILKKKKSQKRAGGVHQAERPEFKPQYHQKKKKRLLNTHTYKVTMVTMCGDGCIN